MAIQNEKTQAMVAYLLVRRENLVMERDNITICAALKAYGYTEPIQITQIMGIDYSHAYSLLQQVEENETLGTPKPYLISPHPILPLTWAQHNPPGDPNRI